MNRCSVFNSWTLSIAFLLLISNSFPTFAQGGIRINFPLDASNSTARAADAVLRTNVVAYIHEYIPPYVWSKFFAEQRVGDILLDTTSITRDSLSLEDIKRRMTALDPLVSQTISRGGRIQLVFQNGMPRWLSSDPHNEGSIFEGSTGAGEKIWQSVPPSDYVKWQEVIRAFVHHFNNELDTKGNVYYVLGNEPESYWVGSEQEFHQYYKHFALGALQADKNAKVGGINPSSPMTDHFNKSHPQSTPDGRVTFAPLPTDGGKPMLYNWLRFSASENLPVKVVTWHDYPAASPVPSRTANWVVAEKNIRSWLSEFGYSGVELILNDWPEWKPVEHENDSEFQAAYVASGVISMVENGTVKPLYLGLMDIPAFSKATKANASFGGGTGLFTRVGLAKPVYNTYALLSKMQGKITLVETGDDFVRALATVEDDAIYLLLANFIPSRRIIVHNTFGIDGGTLGEEDRAALKKQLKNSRRSKEELIKGLLDGTIRVEGLDLPSEVAKKVTGVVHVARGAMERVHQVAQVSVGLTGLKTGDSKWTFEEYVIDKDHANSYAERAAIAEQAASLDPKRDQQQMQKIRDIVNARTSADSGRIASNVVTIEGSSHVVTTTLQPNSVHLIVLRRGTSH
ncbi:MAG: hypothetical protein AB7P42_09515 [Gammaproteobacteria bacterium]